MYITLGSNIVNKRSAGYEARQKSMFLFAIFGLDPAQT